MKVRFVNSIKGSSPNGVHSYHALAFCANFRKRHAGAGVAILELAVLLAVVVMPLVIFFPSLYSHMQQLGAIERTMQGFRFSSRTPSLSLQVGMRGTLLRSPFRYPQPTTEFSGVDASKKTLATVATDLQQQLEALAPKAKVLVEVGYFLPFINPQTGTVVHSIHTQVHAHTALELPPTCRWMSNSSDPKNDDQSISVAVLCSGKGAAPTYPTSPVWKQFSVYLSGASAATPKFPGRVALARFGRTTQAILGRSQWFEDPAGRASTVATHDHNDYAYANFARYGVLLAYHVTVDFEDSALSRVLEDYTASGFFLPARDL